MTEWDLEFPDDWRDREDGLELLISATVRAYARDDVAHIGELVEVAGELAKHGASDAAFVVAGLGVSYVLKTPLKELSPRIVGGAATTVERAGRIREHAEPSELAARVLAITGFVLRRQGDIDTALALYRDAAITADLAGDPLLAARIVQSTGATLHESGRFDEAAETTIAARQRYIELDDTSGAVSTALNLVEYAAVDGRIDDAREQLLALEAPLRALRDPHLYASWIAHVGLLDIVDGDLRGGRAKLQQALRSAERRDDVDIQIAVLSRLGNVAREEGDLRRAVSYAGRAYEAAERSGDQGQISSAARELGVDLADLDEFDDALPLLQRATDTAVGLERVRIRSDYAAVLISRTLAIHGEDAEQPTPGSEEAGAFREAEEILLAALPALLDGGDEEWASRIARNLRVIWLASDRAEDGASVLYTWAVEHRADAPSFAGECFRLAGLLGMAAGGTDARAVECLRAAAQLLTSDDADPVSMLIEYASVADQSYGNSDVALALYDDVLTRLDPETESAMYANVLNDSALVADGLNQQSVALERLHRAGAIATDRQDRVLGSLVELNLGEIYQRQARSLDARSHFARAATLAEAFGDLERASLALSAWASTFMNEESDRDLDTPRQLAEKAESFAVSSGSENALTRALGARASVRFADGDFDGAYALWLSARKHAGPRRRPVFEGFLLETLARQGHWARFSRQMDRFARAARKNKVQLEFAERLWPSANTWLMAGNARRAAKVLAYSTVLAGEGHSDRRGRLLAEDHSAAKRQAITSVALSLAYAGQLLSADVIPADLREDLRSELTSMLIKMGAPEDDANNFVGFMETFVHEGDDDESEDDRG